MGGQSAAAEFICKVTNPKPDVPTNAAPVYVLVVPGEGVVARLQHATIDVNASYSQLGEESGPTEPPGAPPALVAGGYDDENDPKITFGASYKALMRGKLTDQFILVESRRGTGKTRAILTWMALQAKLYAVSRWLIVRSTRTRLTDSAIATFVDQVCPLLGLPAPTCQRSQVTTYVFPNKSEFIFQALDDPERQQSLECCGVYVVEGVELTNLETITALAGCMRQVVTPPIPQYQCIVDCNPGAPGHFLNKVAEPVGDELRIVATREQYNAVVAHNQRPAAEGKWKRIITHHVDNPAYFDVVAWDWTDLGRKYLKTLENITGYLRQRWLYGLWSAAEGAVFPEFAEAIHVVDNFDPPADWPWFVGWDPGFAHPTGIPWVCVSPIGDIFVGDEIYEGGKSIAQHAETCLKKVSGRTVMRWFGDPHEFFSRRAQGESCAAQAKKAGLPTFMPWAAQEKQAMVNAYRQLIQNSVTLAQTGRRVGVCLYVMRRCVNTIMEHQSWAFKKNAKGELTPGDDAYEDANNHLVGDPLVGMVATGMLKYGNREKAFAAENSFD